MEGESQEQEQGRGIGGLINKFLHKEGARPQVDVSPPPQVSVQEAAPKERKEKVCPDCGKPDCAVFLGRWKPQTHEERISLAIQRELNRSVGAVNRAREEWQTSYKEFGGKVFAPMIYEADPFILEFLDTAKRYSLTIDRALQTTGSHDARRRKKGAMYTQRFNRFPLLGLEGTSFMDIENFALPLGEEEIRRIDLLLLRGAVWSRILPKSVNFMASITFLATQPRVHPEQKVVIPDSIKPLYERLTAYFDYYMSFVINPTADQETEFKGLMRMAWIAHSLFTALGVYIPARLGLTPVSVLRLYEERLIKSDYKSAWRQAIKVMAPETELAYRKDSLPPALEFCQHLDRDMEQRAVEALRDNYRDEKAIDTFEEGYTTAALTRLGLYRRKLNADILKSQDKSLRVPFEEGDAIKEVLLTSQNRQTLIMVIRLSNGSQLTIEANRAFEYGDKQAEPLSEHGFFRLRVGAYRVVLQDEGNGEYSLYKAGDRKNIYRHRRGEIFR